MFHNYNSWIVPVYYIDSNIISKQNYKFVVYNYYCNICNIHHKKEYKYHEYLIEVNTYICENCGNENFLHIDYYRNNSIEKNYQFIFNETADYYESKYILHIPYIKRDGILNKEIEVNKIILCKKTFLVSILKDNLSMSNDILKCKDFLSKKILEKFAHKNLDFKENFNKYQFFKINKLEITINYLKNQDIEELELCFTSNSFNKKTIKEYIEYISNYQKSKSLLKALYESFIKDIKKEIYDYKSDFIVIKSFSDINFVSKLIKNRSNYNYILNEIKIINHAIEFLIWLQKYYTQKQVTSLFFGKYINILFKDLFTMGIDLHNNSKDFLEDNFQKVPCKLEFIHDEFVRLYNFKNNENFFNYEFEYLKEDYAFEISFGFFEIKLPKDIGELYVWARLLRNCMASYSNDISKNLTTIYGIFKDGKLKYALEKRNNLIIQLSSKSNKLVPYMDKISIIEKFNTIYKR
jgi:hypothetical protein